MAAVLVVWTMLWIIVIGVQHSCMAATSTVTKLNITSSTSHRKYLPVIRPRPLAPKTSTSTTTTTKRPTYTPRNKVDHLEASGSELSRYVVWPLRRRPVARRFKAPTPTTAGPRILLKLLQPKPTRPAIYSLDGFVPKPSIQRFSTTEAPLHIIKSYSQLLASNIQIRRKKGRYGGINDNEDYQSDFKKKKHVSRYTAFARKGIAGEDYPVYTNIPWTNFDCSLRQGSGMYADPKTDCQVWHMCSGSSATPRHSFLCPNGTIYNEHRRICDWWYNVECNDIRKRRSPVSENIKPEDNHPNEDQDDETEENSMDAEILTLMTDDDFSFFYDNQDDTTDYSYDNSV